MDYKVIKASDSIKADYTKYTRDIILVSISQVIVSFLQFLRLPILTKGLEASSYGIWSIIWVTVTLLTSIAVLGLTMSLVRFLSAEKDIPKIREQYLSIIITVFFSATVLAIVIYFLSGTLTSMLGYNLEANEAIRIAPLMIITQSMMQINVAFFRTFRQMKWYSFILIIKSALEISIMALLLYFNLQLVGVIIAVLISDLLSITIGLFVSLRKTGLILPKFTNLKILISYGLPLIPSTLILWIIQSSDRYIVGLYLSVEQVGIYSAAYILANIISMFLAPMQVVLFPTISKAYDEGHTDKIKVYLGNSFKFFLALSIPAAFGLSVMAKPLLIIFASNEFTTGSILIPFFAGSIIFYGLNQMCVQIFYMVKKNIWVLTILGIAAISNITLNLIMVPHFGLIGGAISSFISFLVLATISVVIAFRYFRFSLGFGFIFKSVIASILMSLAIYFINPTNIGQIIVAVIAGIIIYFCLLYALKAVKINELTALLNVVTNLNISK